MSSSNVSYLGGDPTLKAKFVGHRRKSERLLCLISGASAAMATSSAVCGRGMYVLSLARILQRLIAYVLKHKGPRS